MDKLRAQSSRVTYAVIFLAASSYYFAYQQIPRFKEMYDAAALISGVSWTLIPITILVAYKKSLWKYFNPQLNLHGYWDFKEEQYALSEQGEELFDYNAWGQMKIMQDTNRIKIVEGQTHKGDRGLDYKQLEVSRWWSASCEFDAENAIMTATLQHESSPTRIGGAVLYGVEIFSITERIFREKPVELSSKVYHCIGHGQPRIVTVKYTRRIGLIDDLIERLRAKITRRYGSIPRGRPEPS